MIDGQPAQAVCLAEDKPAGIASAAVSENAVPEMNGLLQTATEKRGVEFLGGVPGIKPDTDLALAVEKAAGDEVVAVGNDIDDGAVGTVTSGTAHVMSHGMEMWHPNPGFFFLPGAGPILDVGPYYVANLINLIGPVRRVAAVANSATPTRRVTAEGPLKGQDIPVKTPTTIHALLEFASGAAVTLGASWDVWGHGHRPMELYGTDGALVVPDPNWFGGKVELVKAGGQAEEVPMWDHPFAVPNDVRPTASFANYRTAGLADMALAIIEGRDARCGLDRALHGIDVMTSILRSGETGAFVELTTTCTRPEPLGPEAARALLV